MKKIEILLVGLLIYVSFSTLYLRFFEKRIPTQVSPLFLGAVLILNLIILSFWALRLKQNALVRMKSRDKN